MRVKQFLVLPKLPESIKSLQELAHNMWYCWNWDCVRLFIRLDPEMWERCYQNPVEMLAQLPQETLERVARDDGFRANLDRVYSRYKDYLSRQRWFHYSHGEHEDKTVAYFSLEYGLDTGLPVYSGGLGILSGDTIKSASDLGIPMVAVGLLYRYGYFHQFLSTDGWQQERYEENDWYHMPVELVKDNHGNTHRVSVDLEGTPVQIQIWKVKVGNIPLYLLDTNIPENSSKVRDITSVLYGGDKEMRIKQEIVLGIGGVRALQALGISPNLYHINEGHAWFLTVERIKRLMTENNLSYSEALQFVWTTTVFTTHTPVPAGNEKFESVLVHRYLEPLIKQMGVSWKEFLALGRVFPDDAEESFCMTVAALKTSAFCNGVSELHGRVARKMWHHIWPNRPTEEVPINSITNGVHPASWVSHDMSELYESYFGPRYAERPGASEVWKKVHTIPSSELWRVHNRRRERLVFFARKRMRQQLLRRGASQIDIQGADQTLDPQVLTIGFARRFSTYKRGNLIFTDLDRLQRLICNEAMPVQIILSGKAHPLDNPGKEIIQKIVAQASEERFRNRIIFLEDYDINVARYMVQGVDVWLNNPRRPLEASGTSGMKAALNGALNLSILDGWWAEGYDDTTGFKIGNGEEYENVEMQDHFDSEMLYNSLEKEVIPLFYDVDEADIPQGWVEKMKAAIQMAGESFSSQRMLMEYANKFYVPAMEYGAKMSASEFVATRNVAAWIDRMNKSWNDIAIKDVEVPDIGSTLYVGQTFPIRITVQLGEILPEDINVEIVAGRLNSQEDILDFSPINAELRDSDGEHKAHTFAGEVVCRDSGRFGITARITPKCDEMPHTIKPKLISWW